MTTLAATVRVISREQQTLDLDALFAQEEANGGMDHVGLAAARFVTFISAELDDNDDPAIRIRLPDGTLYTASYSSDEDDGYVDFVAVSDTPEPPRYVRARDVLLFTASNGTPVTLSNLREAILAIAHAMGR